MSNALVARRGGFSMIEVLATASIIVIIAGMGLTVMPALKRSSIQTQAINKLKLLATYQEDFHGIGDLGVNADGSYATFPELQSAGYIAQDLTPDDSEGHGGSPFLRYYKLEIGRDIANMSQGPDQFNYAVVAVPVGAPDQMPILYMEEDGQVFTFNEDGTQRIIR